MVNTEDTLLTIKELTDAVFGKVIGLAENIENYKFTSVAIDSRNVVQGSLFVPLIGEYQDGHKYIPQAIQNGASVVFVTKSVYDKNSRYYMDIVSQLETMGDFLINISQTLYKTKSRIS